MFIVSEIGLTKQIMINAILVRLFHQNKYIVFGAVDFFTAQNTITFDLRYLQMTGFVVFRAVAARNMVKSLNFIVSSFCLHNVTDN